MRQTRKIPIMPQMRTWMLWMMPWPLPASPAHEPQSYLTTMKSSQKMPRMTTCPRLNTLIAPVLPQLPSAHVSPAPKPALAPLLPLSRPPAPPPLLTEMKSPPHLVPHPRDAAQRAPPPRSLLRHLPLGAAHARAPPLLRRPRPDGACR